MARRQMDRRQARLDVRRRSFDELSADAQRGRKRPGCLKGRKK